MKLRPKLAVLACTFLVVAVAASLAHADCNTPQNEWTLTLESFERIAGDADLEAERFLLGEGASLYGSHARRGEAPDGFLTFSSDGNRGNQGILMSLRAEEP